MNRMTINEMYVDSFKNIEIGKELTRKEIIKIIQSKYDVDERSILPSDLCYNSSNAGIRKNTNPLNKKLFMKVDKGLYKYVGPVFDDEKVNPYEFGTLPEK